MVAQLISLLRIRQQRQAATATPMVNLERRFLCDASGPSPGRI
jgi:hypothetical protein